MEHKINVVNKTIIMSVVHGGLAVSLEFTGDFSPRGIFFHSPGGVIPCPVTGRDDCNGVRHWSSQTEWDVTALLADKGDEAVWPILEEMLDEYFE